VRGLTLSVSFWFLVTFAGSVPTCAQTRDSISGCEPPAQLQTALRTELDPIRFYGVPFDEQTARQVVSLINLIEKYPREVAPQTALVRLSLGTDRSYGPTVQQRFLNQESLNPTDPLALYASGFSLSMTDPDVAIAKLKRAVDLAPGFAWPNLALALIYSEGKLADSKAFSENVSRFFMICPNVTDRWAQRFLLKTGDKELERRVASGLRKYLQLQTDPSLLRGYEMLWALEFQATPPQNFDAVRQRVAEDLVRIERLAPNTDADFSAFLLRGYKQSGVSTETIRAREERILKDFPKSGAAFGITQERWEQAHPLPENDANKAAWTKYDHDWKEALFGWTKQFTDDYYVSHYLWANVRENETEVGTSKKEIIEVFETSLKATEEKAPPDFRVWGLITDAEYLLKNHVNPERALEVLLRAQALLDKQNEQDRRVGTRTPEEQIKSDVASASRRRGIVSATLEAARQMRKPELIKSMRSEVEGAPPSDPSYLSWYWANRARLARVDSREADALAYYQLSLLKRTEPPNVWHGRTIDPLKDEIREFWKESGGSESAWGIWSKPGSLMRELTEGRWEKPDRPFPSYELTDSSGQTWRLKEMRGKVLLINVWATWCGPCQAELPRVQKLYETLKNRPDVQVLTFNVDDDPGLIEPFLKEHGYRFPVLLANKFASDLGVEGIPQNWIVGPAGAWEKQMGFGGEDDWEREILNKIESLAISPRTN
jgi:thiol-disulfide isomerase/thioredoxin